MAAFVALWAIVELLAGPLRSHYSGFQVVWMRYSIHLILMIAIFGRRSMSSLWHTHRVGFQLARSLLMLLMPASFLFAAKLHVDMRAVVAVFWLSPLALLALSDLVLDEPAKPRMWVLTMVSLVAVWILEEPHRLLPLMALVLALMMGLSFSLYIVMTRALRHETIRANLTYTALGVFLALTPVMPAVWTTPSAADFLVFVLIGGLGLLALYALDRSAAAAPVALAAPIACLQTVFLTLAGWNVFAHIGRRIPAAVVVIVATAAFVWFDGAHLLRREASREAGAKAWTVT